MVHSTGHEKRLKRDLKSYYRDREAYAREELIAEMGAGFLCAMNNINQMAKHAAYIKGWSKRLKDDKRLVVTAAGAAQKAVDYISGFVNTVNESENIYEHLFD
jgi:antirestriction protein ArdC